MYGGYNEFPHNRKFRFTIVGDPLGTQYLQMEIYHTYLDKIGYLDETTNELMTSSVWDARIRFKGNVNEPWENRVETCLGMLHSFLCCVCVCPLGVCGVCCRGRE